MLDSVKIELEKEYLIDRIKTSSREPLGILDYQTIYYILSMRGLKSVADFVRYYNGRNDKARARVILETMINPLLNKGILKRGRDTKGNIDSDIPNFTFDFDFDKVDFDRARIKKLNIS